MPFAWLTHQQGQCFESGQRVEMSNRIVEENQKPGTPQSQWDLNGPASTNIEGFTTQFSVNINETVDFKINTDAAHYRIEIYRLGYYGGDGARQVATIEHNADSAIVQPNPLTDPTTGLADAGNWHVTDTWTVPSDLVSGVYVAKLVREDGTFGENQIPFVVRDDGANANLLFQTSDQTWQAYNTWGGNSAYTGGATATGGATDLSYNRPFTTRGTSPLSYLFGEEYPTIRWLEANGYDISYASGIDVADKPGLLLGHKIFLSVGHDEYWSAQQRANVEAARDAGVNLAFLGGNDVFWKTELLPSTDGSNTPDRTIAVYKTTFSGLQNPSGVWTGEWRDPNGVDSGGGMPENGLTGTLYMVDIDKSNPDNNYNSITIPYEFSQLRFWRNTPVDTLTPGETWTLPKYLGYEWDVDANNGVRPQGLIDLSSTTVATNGIVTDPNLAQYTLPDPPGTATHNLTLYRAPSGALVFSAGSIVWSWGLDPVHDVAGTPADPVVQQAMVNLFADMGVQPETLNQSLILATQSTDHSPPSSTVETMFEDVSSSVASITGIAHDSGGGVPAGVEVSLDGGVSWRPAHGASQWSFTWSPTTDTLSTQIEVRAVDDSLNIQNAPTKMTILNDFSSAWGWSTSETPRLLADFDGDGRTDYIGFGNSTAGGYRGTEGADQIPEFDGQYSIGIHDLAMAQGYSASDVRGVQYVGNFDASGEHRFATIWAQGSDAINFYVATSASISLDGTGNSYVNPAYETTARSYHEFSHAQGWSIEHTLDATFIAPTDQFASLIGFGDAGIIVGPQAFSPSASSNDVYVVAGSEQWGNEAGWDSTIDFRAVRDERGHNIDLNGDGIVDVVGMGPHGLQYAFGQYTDDPATNRQVYSLGPTVTADIGLAHGPEFGRDQGWSNKENVRYIADVNNDGHPDVVAFGDAGVWVALGQQPAADGTGAFAAPELAIAQYGAVQGWNNTQHLRLLGDVNGDGLLDVVGFGDNAMVISLGTIDPTTHKFSFTLSEILDGYGSANGWDLTQHFRGVADVNGDGIDDIVASGHSFTQVLDYHHQLA